MPYLNRVSGFGFRVYRSFSYSAFERAYTVCHEVSQEMNKVTSGVKGYGKHIYPSIYIYMSSAGVEPGNKKGPGD